MDSLMLRFKNTFLCESSRDIGKGYGNACDFLKQEINAILEIEEYKPIQISSDTYKLELTNTIYYWVEKDNNIALICELEKADLAVIVRLLGKDIRFSKREPFAYQLFITILGDLHESIRCMSDQSMTLDGYNNWKKLLDMGYKISIYKVDLPGQSFKPFENESEMKEFFKTDPQYKNYQYVLSESHSDLISIFGLRRMRELWNQSNEDF